MERSKAIELLNKALGCMKSDPKDCVIKKCTLCKHYATKEDGIEAISMAIEALEKAPTALDHIHNVVAEREYQRGYKQAKEEYDHKLTVIKRTIKDYWYIKGKEDGKADAINWIPVSERLPKEGHDVLITKEPFKIKGCEHEVIRAKRSADPRSGKIEWWSPEFGALADKTVLAWMEKPEPWKGE